MLSEMVASLFAFAFRPETPAFSDEEIPMLFPLSVRGSVGGPGSCAHLLARA